MLVPSHLDHLPRWRGLPVPFINIWSGEADEHAMVHGPDATVRRDGWFATGHREGDPDFTRQCPQRQRLVAFYGLCQVCSRPVGKQRNVLLLAGKVREVEGMPGTLLLGEPWVCDPCLEYVLRACPGVRRQRPDLLRLTDWRLSVEMQWHDDFGPDVAAAMWINIIPLAHL